MSTIDSKSPSVLSGKLLIAMPMMGDPRFHRAVIFLCAHDESGAMGLVINHMLPNVEFKSILDQVSIASDIKVDFNPLTPVMSGGPVESVRGFLLHSGEFKQKDTVAIGNAYGITGTIDALKDIAMGNGPAQVMFVLGYAGWGAGQLDREIQDNAWLVVDSDPGLIFETKPEEKWERAIQKLGIDPAMLSHEVGRA